MNLLETRALTIGFDGKKPKILQQNMDVSVASGSMTCIMGQNGVGKTTFIKTITGLLSPLKGEVLYGGQLLETISRETLARKLSLVLTEKPIVQNLSVLELITLGRHPYTSWIGRLSQADRDAIEWALEQTQLQHLANLMINELSDGQLQKAMIARALAQQTPLIILDEPTAHLDLHNKIEIILLLRILADQGKGILISTHDTQLTLQFSDRLWLFNFNEPLVQGIPEDLILTGQLEKTLYLQDHHYSLANGTIAHEGEGEPVRLTGDKESMHWTAQALRRNGFIVGEGTRTIHCGRDLIWRLEYQGEREEVNTVEKVIERLKK